MQIEPAYKDEIRLLDPISGKTGGLVSRVRRIRSEDLSLGIWEVLDERGRILYVKAGDRPRSWLEVEVDF